MNPCEDPCSNVVIVRPCIILILQSRVGPEFKHQTLPTPTTKPMPAKAHKLLISRVPYFEKHSEKFVGKMTSMLLAVLTAPALLAINEAIRQGQTKDRREEHRARRTNLVVSCVASSRLSHEIDHRQVALKNNKVYRVIGEYPTEPLPLILEVCLISDSCTLKQTKATIPPIPSQGTSSPTPTPRTKASSLQSQTKHRS